MPAIHCSRRGLICLLCCITALWTIEARAALPPDPDNAALLYYRAFALRPEPDTATFLLLKNVLLRAEPNQQVRAHMKKCQDTIRLADAGTRLSQCNWGIMYSQGDSFSTDTLGSLNQLAFLLEVDAHILAADGDCRGAFDRILSIRRLAAQIADGALMEYSMARQLQYCLRSVEHILGLMPPDIDTLIWLQVQLSTVQGPLLPPGRTLETTLEQTLHPAYIARWREQLADSTDVRNRDWLLGVTEPAAVDRARVLGGEFVTAGQRVIGSDKPYAEKHADLQVLADDFKASDDPAALFLLGPCYLSRIHVFYDLYVRHVAHFNAVRAAIEVYIEIAKSGQVPQTLPAHLPKDPFSGKDFEYQTTDTGFILRCRAKEIGEDRIWEYEFAVSK